MLYLAETPTAAIAEAFGSLEMWTAAMLGELPSLPGSRRSLCAYELPEDLAITDLDDADALRHWELRPSQVVTRDRLVTQAWALRIYQSGQFAGVRWWSYYNPDWGSIGLWDYANARVVDVVPLEPGTPELEEARRVLLRSWVR